MPCLNVGVQNGHGFRIVNELRPIRQQGLELLYREGRVFLMDDNQQIICCFRGSGNNLPAVFGFPIRDVVLNVEPIPSGASVSHARVALPAAS